MAIVISAYIGFNGPYASPADNRATLFELLASYGPDGCTVHSAEGFYRGNPEPSAVAVVIALNEEEAVKHGTALFEACHRYKELTGQEEVWISRRQEELQLL